MTEEEKEELYKAYSETFSYDPDDEEVLAKYDEETNKRIDKI